MDLEVITNNHLIFNYSLSQITLENLYVGQTINIARYKPVPKAAKGTRKCNCRMEMKTMPLGPGRFQV